MTLALFRVPTLDLLWRSSVVKATHKQPLPTTLKSVSFSALAAKRWRTSSWPPSIHHSLKRVSLRPSTAFAFRKSSCQTASSGGSGQSRDRWPYCLQLKPSSTVSGFGLAIWLTRCHQNMMSHIYIYIIYKADIGGCMHCFTAKSVEPPS